MRKTIISFPDAEAHQPNRFYKILRKKVVSKVNLPTYESDTFSFLNACDGGFIHPFLVKGRDESFGIHVPDENFSIQDVANAMGRNTPVRLIDVETQSEIIRYSIGDYADYLCNVHGKKSKVLNMISLEFSNTPFSDDVSPPKFVHTIDWVHTVWPLGCLADANFCRVERYCLVGMAGSYTDFHIDFGGTSVWYHILRGKKRFYLIPPTSHNLLVYEKWTCSPNQATTFLGDLVEDCFYYDLTPGNTLIIPSGWIHSVYTPEESIVFGGNFLHSYAILPQLQANEIEHRTKVSKAYTFPQFMTSHWYFLSEMLPHYKESIDALPSNSLDEDNAMMHAVSSLYVLRQIPFLLIMVSHWIGDGSCLLEGTDQTVAQAVAEWWDVIEKIALNRASIDGGHTLNFIQRMKNEKYSVDLLFQEEWNESIYGSPARSVFLQHLNVEEYNPEDYNCWVLPTTQPLNSEEKSSRKRKRLDDDDEYGDDNDDNADDESLSEASGKSEVVIDSYVAAPKEWKVEKEVVKHHVKIAKVESKKSIIKAPPKSSARSSLLQKLYGKKR